MKEKIAEMYTQALIDDLAPNVFADQILRLFDVMESDCEHEWINDSFDHFGFLTGQVCDKCGAKQSVP